MTDESCGPYRLQATPKGLGDGRGHPPEPRGGDLRQRRPRPPEHSGRGPQGGTPAFPPLLYGDVVSVATAGKS